MWTQRPSLKPITVALAGLIDGINPCASTTLILLISYFPMGLGAILFICMGALLIVS